MNIETDHLFGANTSASSDTFVVLETAASAREAVAVESVPDRRPADQVNVADAVYAHIQAIRALGRTAVDTMEIAQALGLSNLQVIGALSSLKKKGVRIAT